MVTQAAHGEPDASADLANPASPAASDEPACRIIARSAHPVSRQNIDKEALKVLYRLRDAGFTAYLVGGGVRDLYLGKTPKDFDISTDARPGQIKKVFRNSRLIGKRFRLVQIFFHGGKIVEVSTFRRRNEYDISAGGSDPVLADNNTFGTPAEDAFRRDLTINGLFYEIDSFTIRDYVGGVDDLDHGIIRIIGDPERRVTRDPVRMMRAIRHAARNDFRIEDTTWQAIVKHRDKLALCPISRIRDEVLKDLRGGAAARWMRLAVASGLLPVIFPFFAAPLADPERGEELGKRLAAMFAPLDRSHNGGSRLPEHFLLAALLAPWAEAEFDLMGQELKGADIHRFARLIRTRLDEILEPLSIKRATKEMITTLLVNLPFFARCRATGNWPKWIKKKSYYAECYWFSAIHREACGGPQVDGDAFQHELSAVLPEPAEQTAAAPRRDSRKRTNKGAAFANRSDSIFGLRPKGRRKRR